MATGLSTNPTINSAQENANLINEEIEKNSSCCQCNWLAKKVLYATYSLLFLGVSTGFTASVLFLKEESDSNPFLDDTGRAAVGMQLTSMISLIGLGILIGKRQHNLEKRIKDLKGGAA